MFKVFAGEEGELIYIALLFPLASADHFTGFQMTTPVCALPEAINR